jgi:hypothetical protein
MTEAHCPHCGADRTGGLTCPVCELKYEAHTEPPAATPMGRLWQSGRLALGLAAASLAVAMAVPFAMLRSKLIPNAPAVPVTLADMVLQTGPFPREVKSFTVLAVPFAAAVMVQFLFSRTTGRSMRASRPVLFVLALLPAASMVTGFLRLTRGARFEVSLGPAAAIVGLATVLTYVGALRFGRGVPEVKARRRDHDDEHEDDEDHHPPQAR